MAATIPRCAVQVPSCIHEQPRLGLPSICRISGKAVEEGKSLSWGGGARAEKQSKNGGEGHCGGAMRCLTGGFHRSLVPLRLTLPVRLRAAKAEDVAGPPLR